MKFDWTTLDSLTQLQCDFSSDVKAQVERFKTVDIQPFENNLIFSPRIPESWGADITNQFQDWRDHPQHAPSLVSILSGALDFFEIDSHHPLVPMALTACMLGDIDHHNPYHNNPHFREVLCMVVKLCAVHDGVKHSPLLNLSQDNILTLLTAAAIHDLGHDGKTNTINGQYTQSRLERQSIALFKPFATALNIPDKISQQIDLLVLSTDTSRGPNAQSRAGICRDIYMAHSHDNISVVNAPNDFNPLLQSPVLSLMSMMLCEADVAMSAGLNYEFSKIMTELVAQESKSIEPTAKTLHGFMELICHGGFLTSAAQTLMGDNFQSILQEAKLDKQDGVSYAEPQAKRPKIN